MLPTHRINKLSFPNVADAALSMKSLGIGREVLELFEVCLRLRAEGVRDRS
jgi:hypothetical protein